MWTFWWAFAKKKLQCYKIVYCTSDTGGPGPEIFVLQSDEGARENNVRGPGAFAHSAHAQFYNIEAFSLQKGDKTFIFLNFPRFPPNFREKI